MEFKRFDFENEEELGIVWKIYEESFPQYERRRLDTQIRAHKNDKYRPMAIWEGEEIIGIFFYWEFDEFLFIEHFAIDPECRGSGIGSDILREFCKKGKKVILEIDPLDSEIAVRRKGFYERLGFKLNEYYYTHPGYELDYPEHELKIMSLDKELDEASFNRFLKCRDRYTVD